VCLPAGAQDEEGLEDEFALLEEALSADEVVSASRRRQPIYWSPSAITVFTRDDIRASGARDLADLLRRVPGFDVYRLKPSFPLVGARALAVGANNLVLLLIDGREAMTETTQLALWNSVTLEQVERIEVIRGPGSALYGANAYSAVISVTTRSSRPGTAQALVAGGESGDIRVLGMYQDEFHPGGKRLSFGLGVATKQELNASNRRSMALDQIRPVGYLRLQPAPSLELSLEGGAMMGDNTVFQFTGDIYMSNVLNPWLMGKADWQAGKSIRMKGQLAYNRYRADMEYEADVAGFGIWLADSPIMHMDSHTVDGQLQLEYQGVDDLHLVGGGNLRYSTFSGSGLLLSADEELRGGIYGQVQWIPWRDDQGPRLELTGGVRLDLNSITDPAFSPRIAAVVQPFTDNFFRLSYGLAFRKPSFFETHIHMEIENFNPSTPEIVDFLANELGNEDLVNEKVHTFEAGWRSRLLDDRMHVSVNLFYSLYRDTIVLVDYLEIRMGIPNLANSSLHYENQGDEFNALGGEAELVWQLPGHLSVWGNLGLRHVTYEDTGKRSPFEPRLRFNLGGRYLPPSGLFIDLAVHYVSGYWMPIEDPEESLNIPTRVKLGDKFLALGRAGYRFGALGDESLECGVTLQIPLGVPYREVPGTPTEKGDFGGEILQRLVTAYLRGSF
jgi:iron complex outermembrane receptor protein